MLKKIIRLEHPRRNHMVGDGFQVSQYIPGYGREMSNETSPFLMLDYNAPWKIEPQSGGHRPGVGYHPHRGFETVTIVYSGEIEHQDTAGHGGVIGVDEVQWMTTGSGLLHNEFMTEEFARMGGVQHVVQLWVNLPREHKMTMPHYQPLTRDMIPEVAIDGGKVRVIAGNLKVRFSSSREQGSETEGNAAIQGSGLLYPKSTSSLTLRAREARNDETIEQSGIAKTFSPIELYDIRIDGVGKNIFTFPEGYNTIVLVTEGSVSLNDKTLTNGDMVFLSQDGTELQITSDNPTKILVMAGKPLDESVAAYGPFVMNTDIEIMQAFQDYRDGKMGEL